MRKPKLEKKPEIQKRLEEEQDVEKKNFQNLLKRAVRPNASKQSA